MCGMCPSTGSVPSTRTTVPIPTGESSAVQKWNSCGVFGRRSVATTRPSDFKGVPEEEESDRAERLLAVADAVHHGIPARVRHGEWRRLGEDPSGDLVSSLGRCPGFRDLDPDEPPERVVAGGIAYPKIPCRNGCPLRRDPQHARSLAGAESEHD